MAAPKLTAKIGSKTKIKYDKGGNRIGGGTKVTAKQYIGSRRDYATNVIIREDNAEQIANAINQAVATALEEIGLAAERFAKRACPVDTGRLRNSITHALNMDEESVYIGTNVEYAPYVENGTSRRKGVYFLRGAAQDHGSYYRGIMEKHLKNG